MIRLWWARKPGPTRAERRRAAAVRHVEQLLAVEAGMPPGLRDAARIEQLLAYRTYLRGRS